MPPQPGEVSLLTVFADIHYFFEPPDTKPPHHRFDKRSYVYLYHDAAQGRGRIEVANNAGTKEQDAFAGSLDSVQAVYSHKHPTLVTIVVNGTAKVDSQSPSNQQDLRQWHLPAADPRNEGKYMYRLHTLDIYFWTEHDASLFLDSLRRVLAESQFRTLDAAPISTSVSHTTSKGDAVSPIVQQLENVAISGSDVVHSESPDMGRSSGLLTTSNSSQTAATSQYQEESSSYAPIAYNPAAPAAPEPIAHREKTLPPPDAADGIGLTAATKYEHGNHTMNLPSAPQYSYQTQPLRPSSQSLFPGPPQNVQSIPPPPLTTSGTPSQHQHVSSSFPPPPPSAESVGSPPSQQYRHSFAPPPQDINIHRPRQSPPFSEQSLLRHSSYGSPSYVQQTQYAYSSPSGQPAASGQQQSATYPQSPGYAYLQSPGHPSTSSHMPLQSPGLPPAYSQPVMQSSPPPGGYSQYSHAQTQFPHSQPPNQQTAYGMHSQVNRPTEGEAGGHAPKPVTAGPGQAPGRLEQRADKLEKGVNRFLRRLDKKF